MKKLLIAFLLFATSSFAQPTKVPWRQKKATLAEWTSLDPILASGEIGFVTDDGGYFKIGDGSTAFSSLADSRIYYSKSKVNTMVGEAVSLSTSAFIYPQFYGATNSDDTFNDLGITQPEIDVLYPGTGAVTTDTKDWAACQYAINQSIALNLPFMTYGDYYLNKGLVVTPTAYEYIWKWTGNGAKFHVTNSDEFDVITIGMPTDQEDDPLTASHAMWLVNNTYNISEIFIYCQGTQTGFNFGPSYSSRFTQLHVNDALVGITAQFNLNASFTNCNMRGCVTSFRVQSGNTLWTGATTSNSQCNHTIFTNCRVSWQDGGSDAAAGFDIIDASGCAVIDCIVEGTRVRKGVSFYSELTTVYTFRLQNFHYECASGTLDAGNDQAAFWSRTLGGLIVLDGMYGQYAAILTDTGISSGGGSVTIKLQNTYYWVAKTSRAFYNAGNTTYVFENNDNPFKEEADVIALTAGTAISLCGGSGCGNNKFSIIELPR